MSDLQLTKVAAEEIEAKLRACINLSLLEKAILNLEASGTLSHRVQREIRIGWRVRADMMISETAMLAERIGITPGDQEQFIRDEFAGNDDVLNALLGVDDAS